MKQVSCCRITRHVQERADIRQEVSKGVKTFTTRNTLLSPRIPRSATPVFVSPYTSHCYLSFVFFLSQLDSVATKVMTMDPNNPFQVPGEIENLIVDMLEIPAALTLSQTNRHFYYTISLHSLKATSPARSEQVDDYLHYTEKLERHNDSYACYTCLRVKPKSEFMLCHTHHSKGKNGKQWTSRSCVPCMLERGIITPTTVVKTSVGSQVLCGGCSKLKDDYCLVCLWCRRCTKKGRARDFRKPDMVEKTEKVPGTRIKPKRRAWKRGCHTWSKDVRTKVRILDVMRDWTETNLYQVLDACSSSGEELP